MRPLAPKRFQPSAHVTLAGSISGGHQVSWIVVICRSVQPPGAGAAVAVACQFAAELAVGRHYGVALVFITPLALVMGGLGRTLPVLPLVADRVVDTVVGAAVGAVVILVLRALAAGRRRRAPRVA